MLLCPRLESSMELQLPYNSSLISLRRPVSSWQALSIYTLLPLPTVSSFHIPNVDSTAVGASDRTCLSYATSTSLMKRHRAPSDSRPPSNRLPPQDRPRTSAGTSVSKAKTVTSDGMAWKRIFSFRASATQDRPRALSPDSLAVSPPDQPPPVAAATADAASMAASTTNTSLSSRIEEQSLSDGTIPDRSDQPDAGPSEASSDGQSSRPRSLDLSERLQARASYSAESLLLFNHPEGSRSTLSLPYTYRSMHERRLRSPVTVATTSKSVDTLPRPPPKARPKRRDYASYPYFVTPLAFATMNPYIVPATPPSSPQNTKPKRHPQSSQT
ncbi:uncharacterized protein B0H18DRAFT_437147 [Fomitopsis serialis]|uniref:uncharacterized protein n=1 Tax=Fomitopsis serialis TaxID=139415 RepID=UPI002008CC8F|nr:uncharacterized protein B0H18DRAFT_437147 [Neoantrodia serialis]KAH9924156.1 hypothetical protein B0H18DRAFT_437147 [Neoantrodia serialis]